MSFKTVSGPNGIPMVEVSNRAASAQILTLGAHMLSYKPAGGEELLWMSPTSLFEEGMAIRGGVPVCWPWFSKHPVSPSLPSHGFVRTMMWQIDSCEDLSEDATRVVMVLKSSPASHAIFDFDFTLKAIFTIGSSLKIELVTTNDDSKPFSITEALHTYFKVGAIGQVKVTGLDGTTVYDKAHGSVFGVQHGDITFNGEHDAVYFGDIPQVAFQDGALKRTITVKNGNTASAVVWNPWIAKSASMKDFPDDGYLSMLCVETTNAISDVKVVKPGESNTMTAEYIAQ